MLRYDCFLTKIQVVLSLSGELGNFATNEHRCAFVFVHQTSHNSNKWKIWTIAVFVHIWLIFFLFCLAILHGY
jgi:hypothetical protein